MVTESGIRETESAENVDGIGPEAPSRQHIAAPPLAPELPAANREGLPFLMLVAIVVLAGLS
ncbi:MAG: hypothetical protein E5Y81_24585, partial [Mesorhizobium sp.]